jgi:hypothetical protein
MNDLRVWRSLCIVAALLIPAVSPARPEGPPPPAGPQASQPVMVFNEPGPEALALISMPDLRRELLARVEPDQQVRRQMLSAEGDERDAAVARGAQVDRENAVWLKSIVEEHGWPTRSMVGDDGAQAAWLLVQHADLVPAFQKRALDLMTAALKEDEVFGPNVAYLTDRVLVNAGKPQRYGTQFHTVDGKLRPRPVEDPESLEERRKAVGLSTMEEYRELMET